MSHISHLSALAQVDLRNNAITVSAPLAGMTSLVGVYLVGNPVTDLAALQDLHESGCYIDLW